MQSAVQEEKAAALAAVLLIVFTKFFCACVRVSAASDNLNDCLKKVPSVIGGQDRPSPKYFPFLVSHATFEVKS